MVSPSKSDWDEAIAARYVPVDPEVAVKV